MSKIISISPFNRVEGDLKIKVKIEDGRVADARASGTMFRGFEQILKGHFPEDAIIYTPRICGICSISHSIASSNALAAISEAFVPSKNGQLAKNISHATENAMSHITQFYVYFAPDLLNHKHAHLKYYPVVEKRLAQLHGESAKIVITERKRFLEILGLIGGKWPHTLAIQPGGITKSLGSSDIFRIHGILKQFSSVVESVLLGMPAEDYLKIRSVSDFDSAFSGEGNPSSDLGLFYRFADEAGLITMGKGPGRFISGGCYPETDGTPYIPSGYLNGKASNISMEKITESIHYSFFDAPKSSSNPAFDTSLPKWDKPNAYSWAKAPRYNGEVVEVGAIARQLISGDPLIADFFSMYGSTVFTRVLARLHEAVKLLQKMSGWIEQLDANESYFVRNTLKERTSGIGITEAARGILGHWINVDEGRITNYQVITPTGWNASPRDENETPGALEQALINTTIEDEGNPVEIDHIIRSYDPCLVCTVH